MQVHRIINNQTDLCSLVHHIVTGYTLLSIHQVPDVVLPYAVQSALGSQAIGAAGE